MEQSLGPILRDADAYFMGQSKLHETARALARLLDEEGIPYAIAGALALAVHGRVRLTEDVDVLLRKEDLAAFKLSRRRQTEARRVPGPGNGNVGER